jgi:transposase
MGLARLQHAIDWERLPGSCALGPWPTELLPVVPPELMSPVTMHGEVAMELEDGQPGPRRLVGIDPGIASRHSVRVLEAGGQAVCRASCVPTAESLAAVERAALAGASGGTRLAVVFEPTGPAWMPIAVFFAGRGHAVYRVSSAKAADLRKFLHRHAKSNGIDAETLARMPIADPRGLQQLELPGPDAAAPGRRVRACDRLTRAASEHKVRIKDLVRQLMPMTRSPATPARPTGRCWNATPIRAPCWQRTWRG